MQLLREKKRLITLNIAPLIDVMFIMLIFFMVSSTFLEQPGIKLELPRASMTDITEVKEITLFVNSSGAIYLGDDPVALDDLRDRLEELVPDMDKKTLTLKADKNVTHGLVVQIMDITKKSGIRKLIIATELTDE